MKKLLLTILAVSTVASAAVLNVPAGGDLQAAIAAAQSGDTIALAAGATYQGQFKLLAKTGTDPITITTDGILPAAGQRIAPQANVLPRLVAANQASAIVAAVGASHYVLRGLEVTVVPGGYAVDLINLISPTPAVLASYPSDITIDQCFVHGDPNTGGKRGIALNGASAVVSNSYVSDFKSNQQDSQAIAEWTGSGPITITNNYLEGGQGFLSGGAAPSIVGLIPSNIEIRGNLFSRPMAWKGVWHVKNQLELKNSQNVSITQNILENNWVSAQNGYIVLFTVRTCEAGDYSWAVVKNVAFTDNLVRNSDQGVNILGTDNVRGGCPGTALVAGLTSNVLIQHNVFESIGATFLQLLSGAQNVTVDHNTVMQSGSIMSLDGTPSVNFRYTNNLTNFGTYGVVGNGTIGYLTTAAKFLTPGSLFDRNVMVNAKASGFASLKFFPADSFFPAANTGAGLDATGLVVSPAGMCRNFGTDGNDIGADVALVLSGVSAVTTGAVTQ